MPFCFVKKGGYNLHTFEKRLKRLKKDFQRNISPSIRRHRYYLSKGERSRLKHAKAVKRLNRRKRRKF
jgi:ribosomal protein S21